MRSPMPSSGMSIKTSRRSARKPRDSFTHAFPGTKFLRGNGRSIPARGCMARSRFIRWSRIRSRLISRRVSPFWKDDLPVVRRRAGRVPSGSNTLITSLASVLANGTSHALRGYPKEVMVMRVTRKIQSLVEAKIRHAIATGPLLRIERSSTTETHPQQASNKAESGETGQSK